MMVIAGRDGGEIGQGGVVREKEGKGVRRVRRKKEEERKKEKRKEKGKRKRKKKRWHHVRVV